MKRTVPRGKLFEPGNPGRPKGSRNRLGEAFLTAMHADFEQHGADAIARVRQEEPAIYMRVCASILPKEVRVDANPFSDVTDEELVALIEFFRSSGEESPGGLH